MFFAMLMISQALADQSCFDLIEEYARVSCITPTESFEIDKGTGPVVSFDCDRGQDLGDEIFAVFSLASDAGNFFVEESVPCSGGDLWIDPISSVGDTIEEQLDRGVDYDDVVDTSTYNGWCAWSSSHDLTEDEIFETNLDAFLRENHLIDFVTHPLQEPAAHRPIEDIMFPYLNSVQQ